jgi:hypothetical protein
METIEQPMIFNTNLRKSLEKQTKTNEPSKNFQTTKPSKQQTMDFQTMTGKGR